MAKNNLIVTNFTRDVIWDEVRSEINTRKLSKQLNTQLRSWFLLLEEFPAERPRDYLAHAPSLNNGSYSKEDLVQPGDLWFGCTQMDCGSLQQSEDICRSSELCAMSIESSGQNTSAQIDEENCALEVKLECTTPSSNSDDSDFCEYKVPECSMVTDGYFLITKPWWTSGLDSTDQHIKLEARSSTGIASVNESVELCKCGCQIKLTGDQGHQISSYPTRSTSNKNQHSNSSYFTCTQERRKKGPRARPMNRPGKQKGRPKTSSGHRISSRPLPRFVTTHRKSSCQKLASRRNIKDLRNKTKNLRKRSNNTPNKASKFKISFPPKDYIYERGDWVVHAIMSSSASPDDLKQTLKDRGYELKYIIKRKCTLPNKWICSLIASADRTHILTSENIWLKGWDVDFVCEEEDISSFLVK